MLEKDMYCFVKEFFVSRGYDVRAEVLLCDVVAMKRNTMIAIEMKTQLGMKLLTQGVQRQKSFDLVYIAIPKPSYKRRLSKPYKQTLHIIKRLELGLLYVDIAGEGSCMEAFPPLLFDRSKSISSRSAQKTRLDAMEEFLSRSDDYNVGGSVREKRVTAYRENALLISLFFLRDGAMSAKQLKVLGCGEKAYNIIYENHYDWFTKVDKGIYDVNHKGKKAVIKYKNVCDHLRKTMTTIEIK